MSEKKLALQAQEAAATIFASEYLRNGFKGKTNAYKTAFPDACQNLDEKAIQEKASRWYVKNKTIVNKIIVETVQQDPRCSKERMQLEIVSSIETLNKLEEEANQSYNEAKQLIANGQINEATVSQLQSARSAKAGISVQKAKIATAYIKAIYQPNQKKSDAPGAIGAVLIKLIEARRLEDTQRKTIEAETDAPTPNQS